MKKQYKIDTHVHTSNISPCGKIGAVEVAHMYKQAGYDGIVITDHYFDEYFDSMTSLNWEEKVDIFLGGYKQAHLEGKKIGLNVILGMELRFVDGPNDYLVYGITETFLKQNPELYKTNLESFKKLIKNTGILVYQAHPFRPYMTAANPAWVDGIEIFNGNPRHNSNNHLALEYAQANNLKMISGSDFHRDTDLARGGIVVSENLCNSEEFASFLNSSKAFEFIRS